MSLYVLNNTHLHPVVESKTKNRNNPVINIIKLESIIVNTCSCVLEV